MRECLDEGILQSYFDGELSSDQMESASSHLAACGRCAAAARELEGEANLLRNALAPEFEATVPTERLRRRIDAAVTGLSSFNQREQQFALPAAVGWLKSLGSLFAITPQRAFGYAGLAAVLVFGVVFGLIWRQQPASPRVAQSVGVEGPASVSKTVNGTESVAPVVAPGPGPVAAVKTGGAYKGPNVKPQPAVTSQTVAKVKLLPGERSYLKNIAALDSTIKANSSRPMRPALQAEYERNLAVVNRALAATRSAAKKNPNDPDAAEFMFAAYQSKLDLLNTVADARVYNRQP
ncbi:MAG: hypothetical protein ACREBG_02115 [Pyrinomonadaceae bacterium]